MYALACLALLMLCYGWHKLKCKRCRKQDQRDHEAVEQSLEDTLAQIQMRYHRKFR